MLPPKEEQKKPGEGPPTCHPRESGDPRNLFNYGYLILSTYNLEPEQKRQGIIVISIITVYKYINIC